MSEELLAALRSCSLHARLLIVSQLLAETGLGHVELMDRRFDGQKSRYYGYELTCRTMLSSLPIEILVKVIKEPARMRAVDELAHVVQRRHAHAGILVTLGKAVSSVSADEKLLRRAKIVIIDGPELTRLLVCHGIGTRPKGGVDYAFFAELEESSKRLLDFLSAKDNA